MLWSRCMKILHSLLWFFIVFVIFLLMIKAIFVIKVFFSYSFLLMDVTPVGGGNPIVQILPPAGGDSTDILPPVGGGGSMSYVIFKTMLYTC